MAKSNDITKVGPQSYRDLQKQNADAYNSIPDDNPFLRLRPTRNYVSSMDMIYEGPERSPIQQQGGKDYWGRSQYDNPSANEEEYQDNLNEIRYENQPWYDTLANGVGKMLGTAGTTFVSSLVGLPVGLYTAATEGRWSGLWDNDVTNALGDVDKWLEENMTNYRSREQQNAPWYSLSNLGSMNFWADDVIKNAGFTLGAAASMAVGSGSLGLLGKAFGFVNDVSKGTKMTNAALSALFSATGEGMIEARNGVEERNKLELQRLEDALAPEKQALDEEFNLINAQYSTDGDYNAYKQRMADYAARRDEFSQKMDLGRQQIEESGREMGNKILLGNQILLTAGNMIQFGKMMSKSFNNARHAAETSAKRVRPSFVNAERVSNNIKDGYKVTGKKLGIAQAATKGIFTEGSEEMNQQWIQNTAGYTEKAKDANDYWKAKYDDGAYKDTVEGMYTLGNAISQGFKDSWGDINQWEQFVIGGLTGMAGSYAPTKLFNQDKTKSRWNPQRYGEWSGGAYNEVKDFLNGTDEYKGYNEYKENVDALNKVLASEDFDSRTRNLIAHTYLENNKEYAAQNNDKKLWKDEDDKQAIHDIQAFLRAGKLDDLRAIYDEMGKDMSDEEIEDIVKRNSKEVTAEEDKRNYDKEIDEQIAQHQQRIAEINSTLDTYTYALEAFSDGAERSSYLTTFTPRITELKEEARKEEDAIQNLNRHKGIYTGQKRFEGAYLDDKGNRIKSNDEIREEIKHNSDELNRKLDSYLDSIDVVNRMSGGNLTKDQEDNLAYLHNMGKESLERADKIMSTRRKELPQKFMFKTSKTPEQLAKENASSDLTFTKNEDTPEGFVEVDTSLMNDANFGNFFIKNIIMGGNIFDEFGETAEERAEREKEERGLNDKEKRKKRIEKIKEKYIPDAVEQRNVNLDNIEKAFRDNFKGTKIEQDAAADELFQDIWDATALTSQAGEFNRTFNEYMENPAKVDEAKEKVTKEAEKKTAEERAEAQFGGKTSKDIKNDLNEGNTSFEDLDSFIKGAEKGDIKADPETVESAKGAMEMENKQRSLEGALNNIEDPTVAADAKQLLQWMANSAEGADEISVDALANFDAADLISEEEANYLYARGMDDAGIMEHAEARKQAAINAAIDAFNALEEDTDKRSKIPTEAHSGEESGTMSFDDTGHDATTQSPSNQGKDDVAPASPEAEENEEPASATPGEAEAAIQEAMQAQQVPQTDNGGTWRNTTRRYGYHSTTTPFHETVADKNSLLYKRSKAIYDFLNTPDATGLSSFDHVENASEDRVKRNDPIRFRAKSLAQEMFGKPFSELTEQEKKDSIVILMIDDKNNVLGDLPYPAFEPSMRNGNPTKDVILLQGLYTKVTNAFIERNEKDGTTDIMVDGSDGLNMKFKNGNPLVGQVFEVKTGNVPYSNERKTLNVINIDPQTGAIRPFELAIKVIDGQINTGHKKKANASGPGKVGQSYLLLPDASGKSMAVPFATPLFNASEMRDTELYKFLTEALTELEKYSDVEAAKAGKNKEERNKAIDTLCALLQIESPFLDIQNDRIVFRYNNIGEENKQRVEVAKGEDWKDRLLDAMNNTPIQVSLRYINGNISVGRKTEKYNEVIGEIAHTNLPENTTHTVGSWFTLRNLSEEGPQKTKQVKYPEGVTRPYNISGGRTVLITSGNVWSAADPNTGAVIEGDAVVDLTLAQMQAINKDATDGFIQVDINGTTRKYDVKNNKFVENKKPAPQKPVQMEDMSGAFGDWNPGTAEEASSLGTKTNETRQRDKELDVILAGESAPKNQEVENLVREKLKGLNLPVGDLNTIVAEISALPKDADNNQIQGVIDRAFAINRDAETWLLNNAGFRGQVSVAVKGLKDKLPIEEVEKRAKALGISSAKTQYAWNAIPEESKRAIMEGKRVAVTFNGTTKEISVNSVQEATKVLQEWNVAMKRNPNGMTTEVLNRRADDAERRKADIQKERRWLQKNLPMFNTEERLHLIQGLLEIPGEEQKAWGRFEKGVITLSDIAARGTLYHEAFHAVTQTLLSDEDLDNLYKAAVKHYKEKNVALVEELLAEDFRRYVQREETPIVGPILKVFRRLLNAIRNISGYRAPISQLFYRINNGEFSESIPKAARRENALYSRYIDRIDADLIPIKDSLVQKVIGNFLRKDGLMGDKHTTGPVWSAFREAWQEDGIDVRAHWSENADGKGIGTTGYILDDIQFRVGGNLESVTDLFRVDKMRVKENIGVRQAYNGRNEYLKWERLTPEQQEFLMRDGMAESIWNNMSLTEKEQWIQCRV